MFGAMAGSGDRALTVAILSSAKKESCNGDTGEPSRWMARRKAGNDVVAAWLLQGVRVFLKLRWTDKSVWGLVCLRI